MGLRRNIGFLLEEYILPAEDSRKEVQSHQAIRATLGDRALGSPDITRLANFVRNSWRCLKKRYVGMGGLTAKVL